MKRRVTTPTYALFRKFLTLKIGVELPENSSTQLDHFLRFSSLFIFCHFDVIKLISFIFVLTRKLNHFDLMVYKAICCCFWLEKCQVQCYHIYHGISSGEKLMISHQLLFFWAASSWTTQVWWSFCFVALRWLRWCWSSSGGGYLVPMSYGLTPRGRMLGLSKSLLWFLSRVSVLFVMVYFP